MSALPWVPRRSSNALRDRLARRLPHWLVDKVPRNHRESDEAFARRRKVTAGVAVAGAGLLGVSLAQKPNSTAFYAMTLGVAGTWLAGGIASGPLHLGWMKSPVDTLHRPVLTPVATGVGAFGLFFAVARVAKAFPVLDAAITRILRYAHQGSYPLVLTTTLANGIAEEVFFRGALYAAVGTEHPVLKSTAVYALATTSTRNPALVLAATVMGLLFGLQRRATGGIQAPVLTHVTWSVLMLRYLPPMFTDRPSIDDPRSQEHG
ncbi:CPBP family intramembrane metalloprotease [Modestobacter sp. I12A-02628]|uniref:CPBP family intramembrane metalloprotease n=1 Tax=Goekera deserti TaxID=2497753 RepID=A0A7K3W9N5_9ACTN|nr:CPBP family intramembrane glutamic endopeptidase [Goekera deserti]MPQ98859.1 CPBP family intramembrane metalloprotease [Goekera deserti]NDI49642.1 CPBP family intramembrane metalloprotease [Goekera deserti]NEL53165.1 CPBP family intramembrane metalloprotease [Goekera deserti]